MIDLYLFQIHWHLLIGLFPGAAIGIFLMSLVEINNKRSLENDIRNKAERIKHQTARIFELYQETMKYRGAAASEETRANLLARANEDLQEMLNDLTKDYQKVFAEYKKLYVILDSIKAAEVRKFQSPETLIGLNQNGNGSKLKVLLDQ